MAIEGNRLEIGRTFGFAFETIGARVIPFALLVLMVGVVEALRQTYVARVANGSLLISSGGGFLVSSVVALLADVLATYFALKVRCGDEIVIKMAFGRALGVNFLSGLGVMLGLVLLIVPGIYLYMLWALAIPVLMAENLSVTGSLSRSKALTEGHRGQLLGLLMLVWVPSVIFGFGSFTLAKAFWGGDVGAWPTYLIVVDVITACGSVFSNVLMAEAYITLSGQRNRLGALREIFA